MASVVTGSSSYTQFNKLRRSRNSGKYMYHWPVFFHLYEEYRNEVGIVFLVTTYLIIDSFSEPNYCYSQYTTLLHFPSLKNSAVLFVCLVKFPLQSRSVSLESESQSLCLTYDKIM